MAIFADRLREILEVKKMKAVDLSNITGIGRSAISQYLKGTVTPKQERVFTIASKLNINAAWLVGFEVPAQNIALSLSEVRKEDITLLLSLYRQTDSEGKKNIVKYAQEECERSKNTRKSQSLLKDIDKLAEQYDVDIDNLYNILESRKNDKTV